MLLLANFILIVLHLGNNRCFLFMMLCKLELNMFDNKYVVITSISQRFHSFTIS